VSKLSAKVFFKITHRNWVDHHLPSGTVKTCVQSMSHMTTVTKQEVIVPQC